jgi:hypothetical protein
VFDVFVVAVNVVLELNVDKVRPARRGVISHGF